MKCNFIRLTVASLTVGCVTAEGGMPSPLPTDFETISRLTASTESRLHAISFFVVVLLAAALFVKLLWNGVQRDFPQLPRLRFVTAIKAVILWGLVCVVVLTMIAGARELMTPGAWVKKGATYKLATANPSDEQTQMLDQRLRRLGEIRQLLMRYAIHHDNTFPETLEAVVTSQSDLEVPGYPGLQYVYVPGGESLRWENPVVYEPGFDPVHRFVLFESGHIQNMTTAELEAALAHEKAGP